MIDFFLNKPTSLSGVRNKNIKNRSLGIPTADCVNVIRGDLGQVVQISARRSDVLTEIQGD
jgi:hypothetical protein